MSFRATSKHNDLPQSDKVADASFWAGPVRAALLPGVEFGAATGCLRCAAPTACALSPVGAALDYTRTWTAVFQKVSEGYIGFVEEFPGANAQGATLAETRENLQEAITLVLEANRTLAEEALEGQEVIREPLKIAAA